MKKEQAFSGLEAAIVLIAFVVVAAVFSYVMLGAGFFATQKAQEVTYSGIQQSTSNMVIDGNIYGTLNAGNELKQVKFYVNVPIGGQAQDMKEVTFAWSTEISKGPTTIEYAAAGIADDKFNSTEETLQPGEKSYITIQLADGGIVAGQWFTMEMKPKIGAATLTKKTLTTGYEGGVIT